MALKHTKTSIKADGTDATLVQPSDWNGDHVADSLGMLMALATVTPAAPAAGFMSLYARNYAGGAIPAFVGPNGFASALQPFFGRNKICMWTPPGNSTAMDVIGITTPTIVGTATARNFATTNLFNSLRRIGYVSGATAGSRAAAHGAAFQFWRGNVAGAGGFRLVLRWGCSDASTVLNARTFVGMVSTVANFGTADTTTQVNFIGVGTDAGDTNFSLMHNDGAGNCVKTALLSTTGNPFPDQTLSVDAYELALFCAPNSASIGYELTRLNTGDVVRGTVTTDLPVNTVPLTPLMARGTPITTAVGIDLISMYIGTDN